MEEEDRLQMERVLEEKAVEERQEYERRRAERRRTQKIEFHRAEEEKMLERDEEEKRARQKREEDESRRNEEETRRRSAILEMIGGVETMKPPTGRAKSVPRGRRRERGWEMTEEDVVAVEERGRSPGAVSIRSMISLQPPETLSMHQEKVHMQVRYAGPLIPPVPPVKQQPAGRLHRQGAPTTD